MSRSRRSPARRPTAARCTTPKYTATCTSRNGGAPGSVSGDTSPISVTGLTAGKTYTCTVAGNNAARHGCGFAAVDRSHGLMATRDGSINPSNEHDFKIQDLNDANPKTEGHK